MHTPHVLGPGTGNYRGVGYIAPLAPYATVLPLRLGVEAITGRSPQTKEELEQCRLEAERRKEAMGAFIRRNGFDALMATADPHGQKSIQRVLYTSPMQALVNTTGSSFVTSTGPGNSAIGGVNQAPLITQPRTPSSSITSIANNAATSGLIQAVEDNSTQSDFLCAFNAHVNRNPWIAAAAIVAGWYLLSRGRKGNR